MFQFGEPVRHDRFRGSTNTMRHSQIPLATSLIAGSVLGLGGCGGSNGGGVAPNATVAPNPPVATTQTLVLRTKLTLSDADVAKFPADFVEKAATAGWQRIAGGFEKSGPGPNIKVTDGKTTVTTDDQGRFTLLGNPTVRVVADEKKNVSVAAARLSSQALSSATQKGQTKVNSAQTGCLTFHPR